MGRFQVALPHVQVQALPGFGCLSPQFFRLESERYKRVEARWQPPPGPRHESRECRASWRWRQVCPLRTGAAGYAQGGADSGPAPSPRNGIWEGGRPPARKGYGYAPPASFALWLSVLPRRGATASGRASNSAVLWSSSARVRYPFSSKALSVTRSYPSK